ncbi:MAG: helix-turn-helix domain-containing protein [Elusimicrobia bacterium]|nr:helix-turn-helix domain-containing protein [Elusimicrobiota bacterium]
MKPDDILTTQETCSLLGVTRQTLYAWIEKGKIRPWRRLGGRSAWFFVREEVAKAQGQKHKKPARNV